MSDYKDFEEMDVWRDAQDLAVYRLAVRLGFVPINIADIRSESCKSISLQIRGFAKFLRSK